MTSFPVVKLRYIYRKLFKFWISGQFIDREGLMIDTKQAMNTL